MAFDALLEIWPIVIAAGLLVAVGFMRLLARTIEQQVKEHETVREAVVARREHLHRRREQLRRQKELLEK